MLTRSKTRFLEQTFVSFSYSQPRRSHKFTNNSNYIVFMMDHSKDDLERQEWMKGVSSTINHEDYLLGRKIDKTFELAQEEKAQEAKESRINAIATDKLKLRGDPILELQKRKEELKFEILRNPILLRKFRDFLKDHESKQNKDVEQRQDTNNETKNTPKYTDSAQSSRDRHHMRTQDNYESHRHRHHHRQHDDYRHRETSRRTHNRSGNHRSSRDRDSNEPGHNYKSSSRRNIEHVRSSNRYSSTRRNHGSDYESRSRDRHKYERD